MVNFIKDSVVSSYLRRRLSLWVIVTLAFIVFAYFRVENPEEFNVQLYALVSIGILLVVVLGVGFLLVAYLKFNLKKQGLSAEAFLKLSEQNKKEFISEFNL